MQSVEFHSHSKYSIDSTTSLKIIIEQCKARGITCIALTDHDTIAGSLALQKIAPDWLQVIIAEEISTREGHLIGLFLTKTIPQGLSFTDSIAEIRKQGGIAFVPHPFDPMRKGVGKAVLDANLGKFDAIEIFNARCLRSRWNTQAANYAAEHELLSYVGSDAHLKNEYGLATNSMLRFTTPEECLTNLSQATLHYKASSKLVHIATNFVKFWKKRLTNQ